MNIGLVPKQAETITYEFEEKMQNSGVLGEHDPDTLRNTVLFMLGMKCYLHGVEEHYYLHRSMPTKEAQLTFEYDEKFS